MRNHYQAFVKLTDKLIPAVLTFQDRAPGSPEYGMFLLPEKGFGEPGNCANCADILLAAYYAPESAYYQDPQMLSAAELYLDALLGVQHPDGTIDLRETNFHDATCAAFSIQVLGYTWKMLEKRAGDSAAENSVRQKLHLYLERAAHGMCTGGFHTPNHRWVLSSALSLCGNILHDEECFRQIGLYLAEGIDCDENGEFTERSTGDYNIINDRSLIIISQETQRPELLEHVKRNLNMMYCYYEPDFTVFTLNSRRQDKDKRTVYPVRYYGSYLYMAMLTGDRKFAWMADKLLSLYEKGASAAASPLETYQNIGFVNYLSHYLGSDAVMSFETEPEEPSFDCARFFRESNIVRMRSGDTSLTLMAKNPVFCVMQKGHAKVQLRMAASFYAKGVFCAPQIEELGDGGYRLTYSYRWGYTRPFPNGSPTPVWDEMDHASREHVNMLTMEMEVLAHPLEGGGIRLETSVNGVEQLPSYVELAFDGDGVLVTRDTVIDGTPGQSAILTGGSAEYYCQGEKFSLSSQYEGQQHAYTYGMRGGIPRRGYTFTVYLTAFGEARRVIEIR